MREGIREEEENWLISSTKKPSSSIKAMNPSWSLPLFLLRRIRHCGGEGEEKRREREERKRGTKLGS